MSKNKKIIFASLLVLCVLFGIVYIKNEPEYIDKALYQSFLDKNLIEKAILKDNEIIFKAAGSNYVIIKEGIDIDELLRKVPIELKKDYDFLFFTFVLTALFAMLFSILYFAKKKTSFPIQPAPKQGQNAISNLDYANSIKPVISNISFDDVAGVDDVKIELNEIVDFLKNPKKYKDFGIKMPKGVLMVGPPGVGKTLIAKAVAGEASVPFFYQSGASFVEIYVGMGAKRVRELFSRAKMIIP